MNVVHYTICNIKITGFRGCLMLCWARYLFILVVIVLGTSSMLSACGQKGPLLLPEQNTGQDSSRDNR